MDEGQSAYHGKHLKGDFGRMLQIIQDGKYIAGSVNIPHNRAIHI
jgi:hypothetical protein